jgi:hypothetical protein
MKATADVLVTPGDIARQLGEPQHRVDHILNTRSHIAPLRRAGIVRLCGPDAVSQVQAALAEIDARRGRSTRSAHS